MAAAVLLGWMFVLCARPALADPGGGEFVKYYVTQGGPETVAGLAGRFLGAASRATEVIDLNAGRRLPGNIALTDPGQVLPAGWPVRLPWDAVGAGVRYGALPVAGPAPTAGGDRQCAAGSSTGGAARWAEDAVAVAGSWVRGRGDGVRVAVVDSGVDRAAGALAGRVAPGADLTTGRTGDSDCLGSGTAMAGLIAADAGSGVPGMAPHAGIFPVRVVGAAGPARPEVVASGIEVAVGAGVAVIALGDQASADEPAVRKMIGTAVQHGVVVVAPAGGGGARAGDGVLRVGGVGPDGRTAAAYPAGSTEIVAPGVDVATIGSGGGIQTSSGTAYAVAYVAGAAALVRAAEPGLSPAEVERRLERSAADGSRPQPDPTRGFGMVDAPAALGGPAAPPATGRAWWPVALAVVLLAGTGFAAVTGWRRLAARRR